MPRHKTPADGRPREPEPTPSSPGQTSIDFPRSEQLAILAECVLAPQYVVEGGRSIRVSPVVMKSVLKAIDNFSRGRGDAWPSYPTLAVHCGISRRTAVRAVQALEKNLGVLICETKVGRYGGTNGKPVNHYRIVWTQLALSRPKCHRGTLVDEKQSATGAEQSATGAKQSATRGTQTGYEALRNVSPSTSPNTKTAPSRTVEWQAVVVELERLRIREIGRIVSRRQHAGEGPAEFLARVVLAQRVVAHPSNRSKFASPMGAMVYFLEKGFWPIPDSQVFDPDRPRRPQPKPEEPPPINVEEAARYWIERLRRRRIADDMIRAELVDRGWPTVLLDQPKETTDVG